MERLVGAEGNAETNIEEITVEKASSSLSLTKRIADPVVYKLVRVEGDGRLVPATDDELMEVENLLEDDKGELPFVEEHRYPKECISSDGFSSEKAGLESSEDMPGLSQTENMEVDARKLHARLEYIGEMLQKVKQEERLHLSSESPDSSSNCMNVDRPSPDKHNQSPIRHDKPHAENPLLETDSLQLPKLNDPDTTQVASAEMCPELRGSVFGESSASDTPTTRKPDFSTIKGEICLDNLSIRELHETFRATFGRETSVKDKLWLKRRIAMGLTNSCDVSTTSFIIKDKTLIHKKEKEVVSGLENSNTADGSLSRDEIVGATSVDHRDQITRLTEKSEDRQVLSGKRLRTSQTEYDAKNEVEADMKGEYLHMQQTGAKRVRKPTRRYIEELSEVETRECSGRSVSSFKNSDHGQPSLKSWARPVGTGSVDLAGTSVFTRQDSLEGPGFQIPHVSRVRRGRPRENFLPLMTYHSSGMTEKFAEKVVGVHASRQDGESGSNMRALTEQILQPTSTEAEKESLPGVTHTVEQQQDLEPEKLESSQDNSDENLTSVPTSKSGTRRKHHRAWTLGEVMKLVDGVSRYGAGRWSEIKRLAFASYTYRTSVDLKDKWRNLLRASLSQAPATDQGMKSSRKHASIPIPADILVRVRELAETQSQVAPERSSCKWAGHSKSVHESRSGYL
eukprot:TRINITY_DN4632_c0_g1_i5.p1 TRINITY_DN4632_c0_g1~~TRINITY_DN4632_c0_g1_i5.p1  ORF type:complete len:682 (+),score=166.88 TRINITY_DN4632_c0_g1_i5:202-2247(+)